MLAQTPSVRSATPVIPVRPETALRAPGLFTARIWGAATPLFAVTLVAELEPHSLARLRREALAVRARHQPPVVIELRYVDDPSARALVGSLGDLAPYGIQVVTPPLATEHTTGPEPSAPPPSRAPVVTPAAGNERRPLAIAPRVRSDPERIATLLPRGEGERVTARSRPDGERTRPGEERLRRPPRPVTPIRARRAVVPEPAHEPSHEPSHKPSIDRRVVEPFPARDPFGLDPAYRAGWLPLLRFFFDYYWRIEVSGIEHVPRTGPVLIAANHSGAVPADAVMLTVALELQAHRCLRVLYDRFVDALPWIGPLYRRLGAVSSSFANAERLLYRGEMVGLFPEGIAGVEKRWTERYTLRPLKSGAARLSLRTGSPIVPVSIIGAEEAYPVIARLYRVGRLVGVPWIPVTPTFPLCGVAGAVPLPTKWHIRFGAPLAPPPREGKPEEELVTALTARLRTAITTGIDDLLAKRRGIFV